jgi:diguanylate cyclase (GGDEF)-like protein/PAS domain S-box-containing protein
LAGDRERLWVARPPPDNGQDGSRRLETMSVESILVVEVSATLRHVMQRRLTAKHYRVTAVESLVEASELLADPARRIDIDAVVLGLPPPGIPGVSELLTGLNEPEHRDLAVLVFAHVADTTILDWTARRARTALLAWNEHADLTEMLGTLLTQELVARPAVTGQTTRVLFVDDSRTARASYQRLLNTNGYEVETAADAEAAHDMARRRAFDIAIIDYFMPGMNGDELCRRLRADPATAVITTAILTGTYSDQVVKDSLDAGAIECMFKNEPDELFLTRIAAMSRAIRNTRSIDAERERLAGILSSVGDGVYGVDTAGLITFMNPAANRILGLNEADTIVGRPAHGVFHYAHEDGRPNLPHTCFLQQAYASGGELNAWQTVFWRLSGEPVPVECTVFPLNIGGRLEGSVVAFRDVSERQRLERELMWQATHDSLTRLYNRSRFESELEAEVNRLRRSDESSALLYLDLDRFKYINDIAGHAAGDQLLVEIARQLQARLREADMLARLGGDEFAIILRNVTADSVLTVAEGFREILAHHSIVHDGRRYTVNGSIGVALLGRTSGSPGEVLANADIACHIAKARGRNQTHLYTPENDEKVVMHRELGWSTRLQEALKGNGFVLYYQPIMSVVGAEDDPLSMHYETLIRYVNAHNEVVGPNVFLPVAERFGLMPQIDLWVLTNAVRKLAELAANGQPATLTVNISGQTLDAKELGPQLRRLIEEYRFDPGSLILEITETSAIANMEAAQRLIHELKALGCRFALDDFGSGFSSFYHLKHLPVDFVKIDGQFVQSMATSSTDRAIVTSINEIAHSFGKRTVAEFVENADTLDLLRECGVDYAQGYYISRPRAELPAVTTKAGHA